MYRNFIKRLADIVLSFFGIIVLAIPMLVIMLAIKLDSRGPAFFKQKRVGKDCKFFDLTIPVIWQRCFIREGFAVKAILKVNTGIGVYA